MIDDKKIAAKVKKDFEEWTSLKKSKSRNSDLEVEKRKQFSDRMEAVLDISHPNAEYIIRADRLRSKEAQDEDIQFLKLHLKDRVGRVAGVDLKFQNTVQKKAKRGKKFAIRKQRSDQEASSIISVTDLSEEEKSEEKDLSSDSSYDEEYSESKTKKKRTEDYVTVRLPRKILSGDTLLTGKRHKIGSQAMTNVVASLLSQAKEVTSEDKVNLYKFVLSRSSTHREGNTSIKNKARDVKRKFSEVIETNAGTVIISVDGKIVQEAFKNLKASKDRLATVAQSPDFPKELGEQVLGVLIVKSPKGKDQLEEIVKVCNSWNISTKLFGVRFDTTADNTGCHVGSVTLFQKTVGECILWIACCRHSIEVHIKKVAKLCLGETTSPHYPLFKRLHDNWLELVEDTNHSGIDYKSLELY